MPPPKPSFKTLSRMYSGEVTTAMDDAKSDQLKQFISQCKSDPSLLSDPSLSYFRDYLESLGAKLPSSASKSESVKYLIKTPTGETITLKGPPVNQRSREEEKEKEGVRKWLWPSVKGFLGLPFVEGFLVGGLTFFVGVSLMDYAFKQLKEQLTPQLIAEAIERGMMEAQSNSS